MKFIRDAILRWARARQPDFIIGGQDNPYLRRHWLLPRNRFFNVYVHEFLRSDDDRALHTHPWAFNASWLIAGDYIEHTPAGERQLWEGALRFRWGPAPHRVELWEEGFMVSGVGTPVPCWTVFITGPVVREWGFLCPGRFVHWREFTDARDAGAVGKGCGE